MSFPDELTLDLLLLVAVTVGFFVVVFWRFHKHHDDSSDEPVHLPTERAASRKLRVPIDVAEGQRCPCCHGDLAQQEGLHRCGECSTILHWECYRELGCPTMGCAGAFAKRSERAPACGPDDPPGDDAPPLKITLKT